MEKTIAQYVIQEKLGAGGMGVVYKAEDTKLNRSVALKTLPFQISLNPEIRKRFLIEAQAAAALNHPNIATIYDALEVNNEMYIVMEYVDGCELGKKISEKPSDVLETLDIAIHIGEGLKAAHHKGIVHRDIKSQNIMITKDGQVKVMDFGLAKLSGQTAITRMGATVGTIGYMSPEQTRGEEVDQRADIWALGVVLYEMLTGKLPFKGDYEQAIIYSILNEKPKPVTSFNSALPKEIDQIINNALAKLPEERYGKVDDLLDDLNALKKSIETGIPVELIKSKVSVADYINQSKTQIENAIPKKKKHNRIVATSGIILLLIAAFIFKGKEIINFFGIELIPSVKHLAVLPFEVIGGKADDQTFAVGLLETITSKLSQLEQFEGKLWVVPSSEIRRRKIIDVVDAVNKYAVNLILSGSVQKMEKGYRVSITLIDGESKRQLASRIIDDQFTSSSIIQDEAIIQVADMLNIELKPGMKKVLASGESTDPEAYRLYLNGRGKLAEYEVSGNLGAAVQLFKQAVSKDTSFALAYAWLAEAEQKQFEKTKEPHFIEEALVNSNKSIELDNSMIDGRIILGRIFNKTGKYQEANNIFQKALEINPTSIEAYRGRATSLKFLGLSKDAEALYKKAIEIKPTFWLSYNMLGAFYYLEGKYQDAAEQYKKVIELVPNNPIGYRNLGGIFVFLNNTSEALKMYKKSLEIEPDYRTYSNIAAIYFKEGKYRDAARMYEKIVEINSTDYRLWGYLAASYYWTPDERDKSFEANKRAIKLAEAQLKINPNDNEIVYKIASYYGMLGNNPKTISVLKQLEKMELTNVETIFRIGVIYEQWLNQRENALKWIEKGLSKGYPIKEVYQLPGLKNLIEDERFKTLVNHFGKK